MPVFHAPAKINLYLHVTGKRDDGYHLLDSLTVFADDIHDVLTIEEADRFSLSVSGPYVKELSGENLIEKAARLMGRENVRIELEKNIPLGAGLGGGSSDAAATVKALEEIYGAIAKTKRDDLLLKLGADVPVCYHAKTSRFQGIGEEITNVAALPAFHMVLIWPGVHSATKDVFGAREKIFNTKTVSYPSSFSTLASFVEFLKTTGNDLTQAAEHLLPEIGEARMFLGNRPGCLLARMSGSGACVFGIFDDKNLCDKACKEAAENSHWWAKTAYISA